MRKESGNTSGAAWLWGGQDWGGYPGRPAQLGLRCVVPGDGRSHLPESTQCQGTGLASRLRAGVPRGPKRETSLLLQHS